MTWLALALLAPLFWIFSNYVDKYVLERNTVGIFDFLAFSSVMGWIFVPALIWWFGWPTLEPLSVVPLLLGMALVYSYGFYGKGIAEGETSRLVILFMLIPVFTALLAFVFLGQEFSENGWLAFGLVLVGAMVISIDRFSTDVFFARGAGWIYAAIVIWSVIFTTSDFALQHLEFGHFFVLDALGSALAIFPLLLIPTMRREIAKGFRTASQSKYWWYILNNGLDLLGQMSLKKSISLAPAVGLVAVIIQIQSFYGIVLGLFLTLLLPHIFKEDVSIKALLRKVVGATIMMAGILTLFLR